MNKLFQFINKYPQAKLNVYLTRIALPYGMLMTEHTDKENNYIKVDLYAPVTDDDGKRPSFYLSESDRSTSELYSFFKGNILNIMNNYSFPFNGHPDAAWLTKKQIIHRGVIKQDLQPHTKRAYEACLEARFPMELDLLQLADGTVIVGRTDQNIEEYGYSGNISDFNVLELKRLNRKMGDNKILTFEELLDLVNGKVPLLIEIKYSDLVIDEKHRKYIGKIVKALQKYSKRFSDYSKRGKFEHNSRFAIHSANPYSLRIVKEMDCLIPCGIISTDFSIYQNVNPKLVELHQSSGYLSIITPDFISYDVRFLGNGEGKRVSEELHIPLLCWTVKNEMDQLAAEDYNCDNIIIEGAKSFT